MGLTGSPETGDTTMLTKATIALSALLVASATAAAFAYEDPENRIGDRYPLLEQGARPVQANNIGNRNLIARQFASVDQFSSEDPENRIGDRYPSLEPMARPVATQNFAGRYLVTRMAARADSYSYTSEVPENKIADRYPFLEPVYPAQAQRRITGTSMARMHQMHHMKGMKM
jgi:hypothetical protein